MYFNNILFINISFLASTSGSFPWIYQADKIVSKYKKLDVPPPFGKSMKFTKPAEVANFYKN